MKIFAKYLTGKTNDPALTPFIVLDDFSKLKSMEKINTKYSIILPVLDLPPFVEIENLDLYDYTAYEVTVPLIWIGSLPDKYGPFFITVRGNAMAEAGLHDGFFALVNADEHYSNGDILLSVICVKDGVHEVVVRWTYHYNEHKIFSPVFMWVPKNYTGLWNPDLMVLQILMFVVVLYAARWQR
ncbi:MAG: hypothetical protein LBU13_01835 [Synergistaceae bacterium]|nr:hypothetical protein [Synergistaceae bacterium]